MSLALNGTDGVTYNDGTLQSSAPVGKNLIINGDMKIAQRGTSATGITTSGYYTVDRFGTLLTSLGTWTQSQDTDVPSGQGFPTSLKLDCTTADATLDAADRLFLRQGIEAQNLQQLNFGTASAESITLSFWVKTNKTGTYSLAYINSDADRSYVTTYTISSANTWEKKTITIAGDTTGSIDNDNGVGLWIYWNFGAGSDWGGGTVNNAWETTVLPNLGAGTTVNLADSTSNYVNITGVQLEAGTTATDFEYLQYGQQLFLCQRYYERTGTGTSFGSNLCVAQNTTRANCACAFPVAKRASPTMSVYSSSGANTVVAPGVSSVTVTIDSSSIYGIQFLGGTFVANRPYLFYYIADSEL